MLVTSAKRERGGGGGVGKMGICKTRNKTNPLQLKRPDKESYALFSLSPSLSLSLVSLRECVKYHSLWHIITNYISIL